MKIYGIKCYISNNGIIYYEMSYIICYDISNIIWSIRYLYSTGMIWNDMSHIILNDMSHIISYD